MTATTIDLDFKPESFDSFVGQHALKDRLAVHMHSAKERRKPLEHVLLTGPGGCGKSTVANLVAEYMDEEIISVSQSPSQGGVLGMLFELTRGGILFLDEIHSHSEAMKESYKPLMEGGTYSNRYGSFEFPWLTVIAATTARNKLDAALISRFMIDLRYDDYTDDEMAEITDGFAEKAGVSLDSKTCLALAQAAAGVPRNARSLVIAARALDGVGRSLDAETILAFAEIEPDGLNRDHMAYLRALAANHARAGLDSLTTLLRLSKPDVQDIEQLLFERRLVVLDASGRMLTGAGKLRITEARS